MFFDEAGFNLYTRRTRGRAVVGQRAVRQVANSKGPNLHILLAISPAVGVVYHELHRGSTTRDRVNTFLFNLQHIAGEDQGVVVVMDNAPVHNGVEMEPPHEVKKLPAYSPFLNPIEHAFSSIKAHVKAALNQPAIAADVLNPPAGVNKLQHRMAILERLVTAALDNGAVTEEKSRNWNGHSMSYMQRCIQLEDILM